MRAFGDAFYPSALFPYSHVITGRQGIAPNFDPLAVMVNSAHEKGLRFEAWINPYLSLIHIFAGREFSTLVTVKNPVYTNGVPFKKGEEYAVKIRSVGLGSPAVVEYADNEKIVFKFPDKVRAAARGQSAEMCIRDRSYTL